LPVLGVRGAVSPAVFLIAVLLHPRAVDADKPTRILVALKRLDRLAQCRDGWPQRRWLLHLAGLLQFILHILLNDGAAPLNADDRVLVPEMVMEIPHRVLMLPADEHLVFGLMADYIIVAICIIIHGFGSCSTLQLVLRGPADFHFEYVCCTVWGCFQFGFVCKCIVYSV